MKHAWISVFALCVAFATRAGEPSALRLHPQILTGSEGVFLDSLVECDPPLPHLRICDAPAFGKALTLSRAQVADLAATAQADRVLTNWDGANAVRITRRARKLTENDVLQLLTAALSQDVVKDKGELDLHFTRPWTTALVPDEELKLKIIDLPPQGITTVFLSRFELQTAGGETVGTWQTALQAHIWREVWVARSTLSRGVPLRESDLTRERRDVLTLREAPAQFEQGQSNLEINEPVAAGVPLLARALRLRPVVHRGQTVAAVLEDGALAISLKVEAMEDGAAGQVIRIRNPLTRRDLRGKVVNERKIQVCL
ncbi:MAG TPA: flagellar basal body P-ring formation chaperone FlgA [Verrucomicrobiae bacterium]|nr:flagellar basal body P-ring formation chaperone FlgA [Verrucomicrobiae bacterium]